MIEYDVGRDFDSNFFFLPRQYFFYIVAPKAVRDSLL